MIRLLRYLIESENKDYIDWIVDTPSFEWKNKDWVDYKRKIFKY